MAFGRSFRGIAASGHAEIEDIRDYEFQKSGGHRGTTAAPCVLSPAFGGKGGWGAGDSTAQLSTERVVPGGTKKRFGNL